MTQKYPSRREIGALLAILLVAAAIRLLTTDYPLWFDELASLVFAGEPYSRLWSGWMVRESNPPLYYSLLRGWIALFGNADVAVRTLSIVIGLAGIAAASAIARRIGGAFAGLAAAALLAVSAAHVDVSQQVRGYALADTATLIALLGIVRFLDRRRLPDLALYAIAALVALYAHTTMIVFVGLANAAMIVLLRCEKRALLAWLVTNVGVALGWAWWAWITLRQLDEATSVLAWIPAPGLRDALVIVERAYLPDYVSAGTLATHILLAALLGWLGRFVWRDRRPAVLLLAVLAVGAPIALLALSQIKPVLLVRTVYWASGPLVVLVALALAEIQPLRFRAPILALFLGFEAAMLWHWLPARQLEDWPAAIRSIARAAPNGVILVDGDAMAVTAAHYLPLAPGLRLVALRRAPGQSNSWADGLFAGHLVDSAGALALLRREHRLFALTIGSQNPGRVLRHGGRGRVVMAASNGFQPLVWVWRQQNGSPAAGAPQAALSMPSSPNLR